jgi:hypothetical protein
MTHKSRVYIVSAKIRSSEPFLIDLHVV